MKVEVYSKTTMHCRYCVEAKNLLNKHGIPFVEISIEENRDECFARHREATKSEKYPDGVDPKTAPQIFIDDQLIGGHDKLVEWFAKRDEQN